jgi:pyruvate/2-oxoglutarate dehydrogenase complex dihydrolipoamide acyltransferase (E2) component
MVCKDDEITMRKMLSVTVAADRRLVSETYAAEFLSYINDRLQHPQEVIY